MCVVCRGAQMWVVPNTNYTVMFEVGRTESLVLEKRVPTLADEAGSYVMEAVQWWAARAHTCVCV